MYVSSVYLCVFVCEHVNVSKYVFVPVFLSLCLSTCVCMYPGEYVFGSVGGWRGGYKRDFTVLYWGETCDLYVLKYSSNEHFKFLPFQFAIREDLSTCTKTTNPQFPRFEVPQFFHSQGSVTINGSTYQHWLWRSGGHNAGQATTEENWYLKQNQGVFEPGLYNYTYQSGPMGKTSTAINSEYLYFSESVDDSKFQLPSFCERKLVEI